MTVITGLAIADLALLVTTAALGLASLSRWLRHRSAGFPAAKVAAHVALQLVSIGLWTVFVASELLAVGWAAFLVITIGQVFGDLLMFASYRARHRDAARPGYRTVAADVLSFRRPVPALHALVGALAWFGMLGTCIAATAAAPL